MSGRIHPDPILSGPPLGAFIERLRKRGFIIGVDHHLRLQRLLDRIGPDVSPGRLKRLLCPIFAVSRKQQGQFYREFDRHFGALFSGRPGKPAIPGEIVEEAPAGAPPPLAARGWPYVLAGAVLLLGAFLLIFCLDPEKETTAPTIVVAPPPTAPGKVISVIIEPFGAAPAPPPTFWQTYGRASRNTAVIAPLLVFLLYELRRLRRRRLFLLKQREKRPPFTWTIHVDAPDPLFLRDRRFHEAARKSRERLKSEIRRLDVNRTVSATILAGGFPVLRHRRLTRPPEYLALVDLPAFRDHLARFAESTVGALADEGIFIDRFFYQGDPQVCFREVDGKRELLADLRSRYADRRMILLGDGEGLLDPATGELEEWTEVFRHWKERAILTPRPAGSWGMREVALAREFIVLPAVLDGWNALVDHFDAPEKLDLKAWSGAEDAAAEAPEQGASDAADLRERLGEDAFQWLCACAVYPELHWSLTLHLGTLLGHAVTEKNLL
ncbi:MAG: hypothetical protein GY856_54705, partial [bacterium]|nr:hypothetical protein [bacterium]